MKKYLILVLIVLLIGALTVGGLAKPEKYEGVTLELFNRCTEETVITCGTIHINELSSGELHVKGHFASESYIVNITLNFKKYSLSPTLEGTGIIRITCISKGEGPNLILKARGFEWNYIGPITINNFIEGTIDCVGKQP